MIFLILGRGKTGSIVADVAHERGHGVRVIGEEENRNASALTPPLLAQVDAIIRKIPGVVHRTSSTGETIFIEPVAVARLSTERVVLKGEDMKELKTVGDAVDMIVERAA